MAPMRTHTKSRKGCRTCKRRKVKCDETGFPRCRNCTKRNIECEWPSPLGPCDSTADPEDHHQPSPSRTASETRMTGQVPSPISPARSSTPVQPPLHVFDIPSMELFHHYTTQTYMTLCEGPPSNTEESSTLVHTYQVLAPKMAMTHHFLMHSILSLSALHLHFIHRHMSMGMSPKDYFGLASYHTKQAKRKSHQHACAEGSCSGDDSCAQLVAAKFMSQMFLSIHNFCDSTLPYGQSSEETITSLINWIAEQKKVLAAIFLKSRTELFNGPLGPLLQHATSYWSQTGRFRPISPYTPFPPSLLSIHLQCSGMPDDDELDEAGVSDIYKEAVLSLRICYQLAYELGSRLRALFTWASTVPSRFVEFLQERRPRALVILAHFCSLALWGPRDPIDSNRMLTSWWMMGREDHLAILKRMMNEDWARLVDVMLVEARATPHHVAQTPQLNERHHPPCVAHPNGHGGLGPMHSSHAQAPPTQTQRAQQPQELMVAHQHQGNWELSLFPVSLYTLAAANGI